MSTPATRSNAPSSSPAWHALPAQDVLQQLESTADGLPADEARRRLDAYGPNQLPSVARVHPVKRLLLQFHNTLIYFLLTAAVAAAFLRHFIDAAVIVIVVAVNAIVGFIQEGKAEQALDAIRDLIAPHANVLRGGVKQDVPSSRIAPGDVVVLEAGDKVPADLRILRARNLRVEEAILTGESLAAEKHADPVAADAALGDRACMLYSGTIVLTGQATGVAVATGSATEVGRISAMIGQVAQTSTPLLAQINRFGKLLTWSAIAMAAALYAVATLVHAYDGADALMLVVALAVSVVPESLPAVITITLAIGVQRMARRHAVVRQLPAVETLGATSVICTDKTGTLTRNEMTVRRLAVPGLEVSVGGTGYAPEGALVLPDGSPARPDDALAVLLRSGVLCNDARVVERSGHWEVVGDPMEGALDVLAMKAGLDPAEERRRWRRLDEIPFDAEHRYMATLNQAPDGGRFIFVKGAPERVLAMCADQSGGAAGQPPDPAYWHARIDDAAAHGERLLGFAMAQASDGLERLAPGQLEGRLTLLGIMGFIDPPRAEAIASIADCRRAGIAVKMITGDHAATASAIARQLALADAPQVLAGSALDGIADADLPPIAQRTDVFARANPEHKLRIVRALQSRGAIVAMTGDGVNDAPSLKQADVGIAMGRKGTEAAKEASQMVLVDDNFASIVAAVHEGRTVYDNIRKVIGWTLPSNGGEVLSVIIAVLFALPLPMLAVHILWINLVTTVTLGMVLAFEPPEPGVMRRPPRRRDEALASGFLLWRIVFVSVLFMLGTFAVFEYAMQRGLGEDGARTMVVNLIVVMEIFYLFNVRYLHMTSFSLRGAAGTPAVLAAVAAVTALQLAYTYLPFMQEVFQSTPLSVRDGLVIVGLGILLMIILEGEKQLSRKLRGAA
ncbi:putative cation-transporting ATPase F [Pigmentiphaga humi]|uniref:Putative cation-transporting ATPase F n=1 Tax=Pigmentiphaga humi TaxID=2478468 RepID=A0A3P4B1W1_9BURK|nr:HAD-IC family P-type ATPase [Pigmentiphaga humi]VCU69638.1 putative cation-transporting ATPase F [Pigmentiphaga humi]